MNSVFTSFSVSFIMDTYKGERRRAHGNDAWKPRRLCRKWVPTQAFRVATFPQIRKTKAACAVNT